MQSFQTFRDVAVQLDERFDRLVPGPARLEKLAEGFRWAEGPAYFPAGRYLIWSDIPNDRMMRYDETSNAVSVFRTPAGYSNGNTVDRQGRLVTCEHGNRRVTRTEHDGSLTVIDPSYSVRVTRRLPCSQVTRRPCRSTVLPLEWPAGLRNTLTAFDVSSKRIIRSLGMSLQIR